MTLAAALPENSHDGYVAAAYIVFFALILVYVAVMALRLSRMERRLRDMQDERDPRDPSASMETRTSERPEHDADAATLEREPA